MELHGYITKGIESAGTIRALSEKLNQPATVLSDAKRGQRGLPNYACVILAKLIGEEPTRVIAASELVTEKKEERRKVWLPFVQEIASNAASKSARSEGISNL